MRLFQGGNEDRKGQNFCDFGIGDKLQGKILIGGRQMPLNLRGGFRNESSAWAHNLDPRQNLPPGSRLNGIRVPPGQQGGPMSTYVVRFMKDVLGQYGRQIEVCQGTLEIDATDEDEARERAKARFCKDQALHHWSLHADRIHVRPADFPS